MTMHARDANGRRVSLLNDESISYTRYAVPYRPAATSSYDQSSSRSISSSPNTPGLLRSDSYDSQMSAGPASPLTPLYDYGRGGYGAATAIASSYEDYADTMPSHAGVKRPSTFSDRRSVSYDDDTSPSAGAERPGKRYPCRYKDTHNCTKTFTTSGHASRHSKIHTAEKAVPCSYSGCTKKFTRADNMKQHLDTHYKDKSRSSSSRPALSSGDRKSSTAGKSQYSRTKSSSSSQVSSSDAGWPNFGTLDLPIISNRPSAARTPSGLDTLAMAVAHAQSVPDGPTHQYYGLD
ncbi:hypothetical protein B0T16DRAFT_384827 [Cercophora newfieldiana]|uniref:C2H2-type domain-containing protein n=1 Tax=Cercophora newfieldiana TaxID=92897 RepID=A0AA40D0S0_9PEZI|nr:hypothetical protein B0T16DRAFT_384827 [Cercophora newfieldiana]